MILDDIVAKKYDTLSKTKYHLDFDCIRCMPKPAGFRSALVKDGLSIIGEVKRASPSKGVIRDDFNPVKIAEVYGGAVDAISVLTEEHFFYGKAQYLSDISQRVSLPLLRKDFIIDEFQIYEARFLGASAVLLIVRILSDVQLKLFLKIARDLMLDALVETHNEDEVERALSAGADIIGINNRNLEDFSVDLSTTVRLSSLIPSDNVIVSESGIHTLDDIVHLKNSNVDAVLIGESFMRADDIVYKAMELRAAYDS